LLSDEEAKCLMQMEKKIIEQPGGYFFPSHEQILTLKSLSIGRNVEFLFDIGRKYQQLSRCTYQERYEKIIVLVRVDIKGPSHTNPDDSMVSAPHIHIFKEGFSDKWAYPLSNDHFRNPSDLYKTMYDFFTYCRVVDPPIIQKGLFV